MCTSIAMRNEDFYFGRNMDIDYSFGEKVVITPRNYPFRFRYAGNSENHYALIGMASVTDNYPLYAEASNEKGLCMAGLNFPDNACYSEAGKPDKSNIAVFELIPWILGQCSSVQEAEKLLEKTNLISEPFSSDIPTATLHWHIADKNSSIVLESTHDGLHIYDNPVDVLTNNPTFDFHMTNLCQYANLSVRIPENCLTQKSGVKLFGKGMGSCGLPGDFSPASRFVKASYILANSVCKNSENDCISQFFHILDSVAVVNGSIEARDSLPYFTVYSCCINADKGTYYCKTYNNNQISAVNIFNSDIESSLLMEFPLTEVQQICFKN